MISKLYDMRLTKLILTFLIFTMPVFWCKAVEPFTPELLQRATNGDAEAQYQLALCYNYGNGVEEDSEKLMYWMEAAAHNGHIQAQYTAGMMYYTNFNREDYLKAIELFKLAADQGHAESQFQLGIIYDRGKYISKNEAKAFGWYLKAAKQGHKDGAYAVGLDYYMGTGVAKDYKEAARWLRLSDGKFDAQEILDLIEKSGKLSDD